MQHSPGARFAVVPINRTSSIFQNRLFCGNEGVRVRFARNCPMAEGLNLFACSRVYARLPRSDRRLALQHQAVEVAPLVHVVVEVGLVDDAAVVPDHKVAVAPLVANSW